MEDMIDSLKSYAELKAEAESKETTPAVDTEIEATEPVDGVDDNTDDEDSNDDDSSESTDNKTKEVSKDETPWGKSEVVPKGIQKRFKQLTQKARDSERKFQEMEKAFKIITASSQQENIEPTFANDAERINYLVEQRFNQEKIVNEQRRQYEQQVARDNEELNSKWNVAYESASKDLPDFDDVIADSEVVLPNSTLRYLALNDVGPYISYTIAKNQDLQDEINTMTPADRHGKVLEVEANVRKWLSARTNVTKSVGSVQLPPKNSNGKPKVPGSLKNSGSRSTKLDPATASIEDWLNQ